MGIAYDTNGTRAYATAVGFDGWVCGRHGAQGLGLSAVACWLGNYFFFKGERSLGPSGRMGDGQGRLSRQLYTRKAAGGRERSLRYGLLRGGTSMHSTWYVGRRGRPAGGGRHHDDRRYCNGAMLVSFRALNLGGPVSLLLSLVRWSRLVLSQQHEKGELIYKPRYMHKITPTPEDPP